MSDRVELVRKVELSKLSPELRPESSLNIKNVPLGFMVDQLAGRVAAFVAL